MYTKFMVNKRNLIGILKIRVEKMLFRISVM